MEKLETKDYKLVKVYDKKYVFLTGSQDVVTTQHPMGISNRLTVVLQQELH